MQSDGTAIMKKLNYFDLHCDTLTKLYDKGETLSNSTCMLKKSDNTIFEKCAQVFAVFSKKELGNEDCFRRFFEAVDYFKENEGDFCKGKKELEYCAENSEFCKILSVEDLRLTDCDEKKLLSLTDYGVKLVTPLWAGETCVGGSFDTDVGLSEKGRALVEKCFTEKLIVDVSHASRKSTDEMLEIAQKHGGKVLASHSNSFSVCRHPRNLTDSEAIRIKELGGIVGINVVPAHLSYDTPTSDDVVKHIFHFLELIGEDSISLGCDFDGIRETPSDLTCRADLINLAENLKNHGMNELLLNKIFYLNAYNYFLKNIKEN